MEKLNLGSGKFRKEGFVNIDWEPTSNPDVIHDLNVLPYPFADNTFDLIEADHVLEHLSDPFGVMRDIHRIAKSGAVVIIRVPHFSRGFSHPEHKRGFDMTFSYYFRKSFQGGYQSVEYDLEKIKMTWFAQKYLKKQVLSKTLYSLSLIPNYIFNFFANISPMFCSRIWCFWVGGFEEIEFVFKVKKRINNLDI